MLVQKLLRVSRRGLRSPSVTKDPAKSLRRQGSVSIKTVFLGMKIVSYTWACETSAGCLRSICLVHPGVRDKRRVSEIDLSQPRHETAFW